MASEGSFYPKTEKKFHVALLKMEYS